ncbi:hypothetical protein [Sediminitomix flava]|uniref:Outer membrane beta-barrel porin/alpha-amylase n=1 Tax=Sediminitomix flava TaxID=379075 RepID=A0A315Z6D9_SEDFL|nr:hypothetical protein [Sediminitomix flava]PWJ38540.1 hypothetical protein BC781_107130 [Sediminitomix flava]
MNKLLKSISLGLIISAFSFNFGFAQDGDEHSKAELAQKLANPVSNLISVPMMQYMDFGIGEHNGSRYQLQMQPVIPAKISDDINLITRAIIPIVSQHNVTGAGNTEAGLGDIVLSGFFSPSKMKNGFIWGVGPAFSIPTASNNMLGAQKFGVGPTAVALKQSKTLTYGALINQIWSVAGNSERSDISQLYIQPFVAHNWSSGGGVSAMIEYTQDWESKSADLWLTPSLTGITSLGNQKISFAVGPRFNLVAPENMKARFGMRGSVTFLFPTAKK